MDCLSPKQKVVKSYSKLALLKTDTFMAPDLRFLTTENPGKEPSKRDLWRKQFSTTLTGTLILGILTPLLIEEKGRAFTFITSRTSIQAVGKMIKEREKVL